MEKKKVLIIGGGFGGVRAALDLDKKLSAKEVEITLVDKNNFHLFLPDLYEVASAVGNWKDCYHVQLKKMINIPYADIFEGTRINFFQAEIIKIDLEKREAVSGGSETLGYDYLVLGPGAETETFGISGVSEYAYKFKNVDEALFLNQRINEVFDQVKKGQHSEPVSLVVAGAGFNGVELVAELGCLAKKLSSSYKIKVLEAAPQILPMVSAKERRIIRNRLTDLNIEILENKKIAEVGPDFVEIEGGERYKADFIIWTAGIRASSFLKNIFGLRLDERGKMIINNFLQAEGWTNLLSLGDSASFVDVQSKKPIPGLAYVAVAEGKIVAENIYRLIKNKHLKSYQPFYSTWVAPVGGKFAVAHLSKKVTVSGFLGWVIRELIDLRYFISILPFSKAISLFTETITLFTKND